ALGHLPLVEHLLVQEARPDEQRDRRQYQQHDDHDDRDDQTLVRLLRLLVRAGRCEPARGLAVRSPGGAVARSLLAVGTGLLAVGRLAVGGLLSVGLAVGLLPALAVVALLTVGRLPVRLLTAGLLAVTLLPALAVVGLLPTLLAVLGLPVSLLRV